MHEEPYVEEKADGFEQENQDMNTSSEHKLKIRFKEELGEREHNDCQINIESLQMSMKMKKHMKQDVQEQKSHLLSLINKLALIKIIKNGLYENNYDKKPTSIPLPMIRKARTQQPTHRISRNQIGRKVENKSSFERRSTNILKMKKASPSLLMEKEEQLEHSPALQQKQQNLQLEEESDSRKNIPKFVKPQVKCHIVLPEISLKKLETNVQEMPEKSHKMINQNIPNQKGSKINFNIKKKPTKLTSMVLEFLQQPSNKK